MHKLTLFVLGLSLSTSAFAGLYLQSKLKTMQPTSDEVQVDNYLQNQNAKIEQKDIKTGKLKQFVIFYGKEQKFLIFDPEKKEYQETDLKKVVEEGEKNLKLLRENLKKMPLAQKKMYEKELAYLDRKKGPPPTKKGTHKVAGKWSCTEYEQKTIQGGKVESCFATASQLGVPVAEIEAMVQMSQASYKLMQVSGAGDNAYLELSNVSQARGIPIEIKISDAKGALITHSELKEIKTIEVAKDAYEVPKGYKKSPD